MMMSNNIMQITMLCLEFERDHCDKLSNPK